MSITHPSLIDSPFDQIKQTRPDGSEFWSARDLMPLAGYGADWRNFLTAVERAKLAASNSGYDVDALFGAVTEKTGGRPREDFQLARVAAYLVSLNGDPAKPESASAQAYFVVRTREAETAPTFALPATFSEALRLLADETERTAQLEAKAAADAPKVNYVETYVADGDLLTFRTLASNLNVSEQWLRDLLISSNWIYMQEASRWSEKKQAKETIRRYSAYAGYRNYFEAKPVHDAPRFRGEVMHTLKVTPAGAEAIARLVRRSQIKVVSA